MVAMRQEMPSIGVSLTNLGRSLRLTQASPRNDRSAHVFPSFDITTLIFITIINLVVVGVHIGLAWYTNRPVPGFFKCGTSMAVVGIGLLGLLLRVVVPGKLVILIPNLLVAIGGTEMMRGMRDFRGLNPGPGWAVHLLYLLYALVMAYGLWVHEDFALRSLVSGLFVGCTAFMTALTLAVRVPRGERAVLWPAALGYAVHGCVMFAWAILAGTGHGGDKLFLNIPIQILTVASTDLVLILGGFGLSAALNLRLRREIEGLAHYDSLTHLPNRRFFDTLFDEACRNALRHGRRLALVYMDIDDFKMVNDTLGHDAGDAALKLVAERLRPGLAGDDCLARLGGDEFVMLLQNVRSEAEVVERVRRMRGEVAREAVIAGRRMNLALSCGYALSAHGDESYYDLVRRADAAMYDAKSRKPSAEPGRRPERAPSLRPV
jgi:diguanylate cyclase (GGDEF)-like protein